MKTKKTKALIRTLALTYFERRLRDLRCLTTRCRVSGRGMTTVGRLTLRPHFWQPIGDSWLLNWMKIG